MPLKTFTEIRPHFIFYFLDSHTNEVTITFSCTFQLSRHTALVPLWVTGKPGSLKAYCPIAWTSVPSKITLFLLYHNHQSYSNYFFFFLFFLLQITQSLLIPFFLLFCIQLPSFSSLPFFPLLTSFCIPCQHTQWFIMHHDCCGIPLPLRQTTSVPKVMKCKQKPWTVRTGLELLRAFLSHMLATTPFGVAM